MTVRAKFKLTSREEFEGGMGRKLKFQAIYDPTIEEDRRFAKATPSGTFEMYVDNPSALDYFTIGKSYYFDISEAK